jgi:hypothetical protein
MIYVFDTSSLVVLFRYFYPDRFPSLWEKFESTIAHKEFISAREVINEINNYAYVDRLSDWANGNKELFPTPTEEELSFVTDIFAVDHFQNMIRRKERLQGKPVADPFVIAKAKIVQGTVVTQELWKDNSAKLPNVCDHFNIPCIDLENFMEKEDWTF